MAQQDEVTDFKSSAWKERSRVLSYVRSTHSGSPSSLSIRAYVDWIGELYPGERVLDVGAGTGALAVALAAHGFPVTALDISEEMLSQIPRKRRIQRVVGDIFSPGLGIASEENRFPVMASRWVLPHFPNWPTILENMSGLLRADGSMFIDFPNPDHYRLAKSLSQNDESVHGYDFSEEADSFSFYRAPRRSEIEDVASGMGLHVAEVRPASFLASNAIFLEQEPVNRVLGRAMSSRGRRSVVQELDRLLVGAVPSELCGLLIYRITWGEQSQPAPGVGRSV